MTTRISPFWVTVRSKRYVMHRRQVRRPGRSSSTATCPPDTSATRLSRANDSGCLLSGLRCFGPVTSPSMFIDGCIETQAPVSGASPSTTSPSRSVRAPLPDCSSRSSQMPIGGDQSVPFLPTIRRRRGGGHSSHIGRTTHPLTRHRLPHPARSDYAG